MPETPWLLSGLVGYAAGAVGAWTDAAHGRRAAGLWLALTTLGVSMLAAAIAVRWMSTGYGPFVTLFEVLLSNLFSLGLICVLVFWRVPLARPAALVVLPLLLFIGVWNLTLPAAAQQLPATYDTLWLWVHVGVGKVFLGLCLVAVGLAGVLASMRLSARVARVLPTLPDATLLDALAWRFMAAAFVFHTLMLIAGAVWAQDAWGRFWAWDPLETWAFVTWLVLGLALHLRVTWRLPPPFGWSLIFIVFALAFLTFFGLPFASLAPHKGIL